MDDGPEVIKQRTRKYVTLSLSDALQDQCDRKQVQLS